MFLFHWSVIILIPGFILGLWAQHKVKSTFRRYSKVPASNGLTGHEMARRILAQSGVTDVKVEATRGELSDHYDPRTRTVRLSETTYCSVSAMLAATAEITHEIIIKS